MKRLGPDVSRGVRCTLAEILAAHNVPLVPEEPEDPLEGPLENLLQDAELVYERKKREPRPITMTVDKEEVCRIAREFGEALATRHGLRQFASVSWHYDLVCIVSDILQAQGVAHERPTSTTEIAQLFASAAVSV